MADLLKYVDCLRKPELTFEVVARGGSVATVVNMRSALRNLLINNKLPDPAYFTETMLIEHITLAKNTITILSEDIEAFDLTNPDKLLKLKARVSFCDARLKVLENAVKPAKLSLNSSLGEDLASLQKEFATCKSQFDSLESHLVSVSSGTSAPLVPQVPVSAPLSEPLPTIGNTGCDLAVPIATPYLSVLAEQKPFIPASLYGKLSHPAERLISTIPFTDGFDLDKLLKLLKVALTLCQTYPDIKSCVLSFLLPYARGPLSSCLLRHSGFAGFHKEALSLFIPAKRRNSLEQELFYRPQGHNETLHHFVDEIKQAAQLLLIDKSEAEVTEVIIDALSPEVRSCLVFASKPRCFADLDKLCAQVNNTLFVDKERASNYVSTPRAPHQQYRPSRPQITCHGCGQRGHIRPQCTNRPQASARPAGGSGFRPQYQKNESRRGN